MRRRPTARGPSAPPGGVAGAASLRTAAWLIPPSRMPSTDPHAGHLRVTWEASYSGVCGFPGCTRKEHAAGTVPVDAATGAVASVAEEPSVPAPASLVPGWTPAPGTLYWTWSDGPSGSAGWIGGAPRPSRIDVVMGYLALEGGPARNLVLHRWRPLEPLSPVPIDAGADFYPIVSLDGRRLVVVAARSKSSTTTLYDFATLAKGTPAVRWSHPLAARHVGPPRG